MFRTKFIAQPGSRIDVLHSIYRTVGDLKMFRHMGIRDVISSLVLPQEASLSSGRSYYDFYNWLCNEETKRCENNNIRMHAVIGIPPAHSMNPKVMDEALLFLDEFLSDKKAIGIGEIGMGRGSKEEYMAFKRQLSVAQKYDLPVIVQSPKYDKVALTSIILKELKKAKIERAIIDHCDKDTLQLVIRDHNDDIKVGITVGQQAISPEEALQIFQSFSYENRIVLDSGLGIYDSSIFGVSNAIELFADKVNEEALQKMIYDNYTDVFPGISSRIKTTL